MLGFKIGTPALYGKPPLKSGPLLKLRIRPKESKFFLLKIAIRGDGISPDQRQHGGWSDGAMVLGKLSVPGRPTSLDGSRARVYWACNRCGWGVVWTFFSHLSFLISFSLFGRRPDIA